jgi:glycosyltransferase involved in cell wall biosynthesis
MGQRMAGRESPAPSHVRGDSGDAATRPGPVRRLRVGMAVYGDLTFDSRVRREAATLARAGHDVVLVCLANDGGTTDLAEGVTVVVRRPTTSDVLPRSPNPFRTRGMRRVRSAFARVGWLIGYARNLRVWGRMVVDCCAPVDVWHLHDLTGLAGVVPALPRQATVVYDSHEIFIEAGTGRRLPRPAQALLRAYERRLVSRVAAMVTVNEAVAGVLRRRYHPARTVVVHNCPELWSPPEPRPDLIRQALRLTHDVRIVLYHGSLGPHRGIEQLMEALRLPALERAHLVLLGGGPGRDQYLAEASNPEAKGRIHVLDPVPPRELLDWVASADVGAMPIEPSTLNHFLSTPNKLFECLAAGTPVVTSDFPAMREVVLGGDRGPLGAVCDPGRVEDVAAAIGSVLELDPDGWRSLSERCLAAAHTRWNWNAESDRLVRMYQTLVLE